MRDAWNNHHPAQNKHQIQKKKQEIHTILEEMVQKHLQTKTKKLSQIITRAVMMMMRVAQVQSQRMMKTSLWTL